MGTFAISGSAMEERSSWPTGKAVVEVEGLSKKLPLVSVRCVERVKLPRWRRLIINSLIPGTINVLGRTSDGLTPWSHSLRLEGEEF